MTYEGTGGPIVYLLQTEASGRVVQYTMRLETVTVLREAGEPLRVISRVYH